jgi:hypothetical protein
VNPGRLWRRVAVAAAALIATGIYWAPAFERLHNTGNGDWTWFHHMWEAGRIAIRRWHEVPLWNPYHCGGASLWGNPQAQVFAPTYLLLGVPFGTTVGHKLFVLEHAVLGWVGMYFVGRRIVALSVGAAAFAATMWCASGFFAWHGSGGHATFLSFYYGPLVLLAWRATARDFRYAAAVAALMVLIVTEGGQYSFPFFVFWMGVDLLMRLGDRGAAKRLLATAVATFALTMALAAFRVIPVLRAVTDNPRPVIDTDRLSLGEIVYMMTRRSVSSWHFPGHQWVWPEYGAYVGWTMLALFAAGLLAVVVSLTRRGEQAVPSARPRRESVWLLVGLVLFFLLTEGNASPIHPWPLLQKLPIYRSIHLPSRWRVLLLFYLALVAGVGLDALFGLMSRLLRKLRAAGADTARAAALAAVLPAALAAVAVVDTYGVNHGIVDRWLGPPLAHRHPEPHFYLVEGRNYLADFMNYPSENVGTERCYDPVPWKVSPQLRLGRVPQATAGAATATIVDWGRTSSTVWADVRLTAPTLVTFNQNMAPGWISDQGPVVSDGGRLAVRAPGPFEGRITARFRPPDLPYSVPISAVAAAACVVVGLGRWPSRRRGQRP